jgi:hypothetical protein
MKKRMVRIMLLVLLICLFSVYGSGEQSIKPGETIVFAENVIIKGPFITPKLVSKEEFEKTLGYQWRDEVPYKLDIPYKGKLNFKDFHEFKTYHELDVFLKQGGEYPWPLVWPSSFENGEQFIPLAKPEDKKPKFIPIEPLEAKYKFLRGCFVDDFSQ